MADALVGSDKLPALHAQHRRRHAAKTLAFEHPDSEAMALEQAGILQINEGRYRPPQPLSVDTSAEPAALNRVKAHWTQVALQRTAAPRRAARLTWLQRDVALQHRSGARARDLAQRLPRDPRARGGGRAGGTAVLLNLQLVTFAPVA